MPKGYAPVNESTWIPAQSGSGKNRKNYWIDPACGLDLDREAPYVLMFDCGLDPKDPGYVGLEVFRATNPPQSVRDLLNIFKVHTNGLSRMKNATTMRDVWLSMKQAIRESSRLEAMVWNRLPHAKFGFITRDIFQMEPWKNKTTFKLKSNDELMGMTELMIQSRVQTIGYDLSKIEGYDSEKIIGAMGWQAIKLTLLKMMDACEFMVLKKQLKLAEERSMCHSLTKEQMKVLEMAASGELSLGDESLGDCVS